MLHADAIADRTGSSIAALRSLAGRAWARVRPLLVAGVQALAARHAERIVREMPDHLLKDIGIARSDIRRAVRRGRA